MCTCCGSIPNLLSKNHFNLDKNKLICLMIEKRSICVYIMNKVCLIIYKNMASVVALNKFECLKN